VTGVQTCALPISASSAASSHRYPGASPSASESALQNRSASHQDTPSTGRRSPTAPSGGPPATRAYSSRVTGSTPIRYGASSTSQPRRVRRSESTTRPAGTAASASPAASDSMAGNPIAARPARSEREAADDADPAVAADPLARPRVDRLHRPPDPVRYVRRCAPRRQRALLRGTAPSIAPGGGGTPHRRARR